MLEERYWTVSEIAEKFQLNPQTVRNWIDAGQLAAVRLGSRRVRVAESELERFIAANPVVTGNEADEPRQDRAEARPATRENLGGLASDAEAVELADALENLARAARTVATLLSPHPPSRD